MIQEADHDHLVESEAKEAEDLNHLHLKIDAEAEVRVILAPEVALEEEEIDDPAVPVAEATDVLDL